MGYRVAVDYGTSYTAAVVDTNGSRGPEVVEFAAGRGSRYLPSAVVVDSRGELVVGHRALAMAGRVDPGSVCLTPKRLLHEPEIRLGERILHPAEVLAATLTAVAGEVRRRHGGADPDELVMTYPAAWGDQHRDLLSWAAVKAGLVSDPATVVLVPEPVAAAAYYTRSNMPAGSHVAVFDLGGGTFDTAVLVATGAGGFELAGRPGGDPYLGGEDFDELLMGWVAACLESADPGSWARFEHDESPAGFAGQATLRDEVRQAKEYLSDDDAADILLPPVGFATEALTVRREEFIELIADTVDRAVSILASTIADAGIDPRRLAGLYLTGGSSRIPAVATAIHTRLGVAPSTHADPKAVTALGALNIRNAAVAPVQAADSSIPTGPAQDSPSAAEVQIFSRWTAYGKGGFKSGNLVLTNRRISFTMKISKRVVFDVPLSAVRELSTWATGVTMVLADGSRHHFQTGIPFKQRVRAEIQHAVDAF